MSRLLFRYTLRLLLIVILSGVIAPACADDRLGDFEQQATRPDPNPRPHPVQHTQDEDDDADELFSDDIWLLPLLVLGYGGVSSWENAQTRDSGSFLIPLLRLDLTGQQVDSDVSALQLDLEAGYGPLAVNWQRTLFEEKQPATDLTLDYYLLLYRMSFGDAIEVDLGGGGITLTGSSTSHGGSLTLPVRIHPNEHYGIFFRPVWSSINGNPIDDYSLGAQAGWNRFQFEAGYRWLAAGSASLNGPFAGITVAF